MAVTRSGQITVTTAGTAVAGPDTGPGTFQLCPVPANTGATVYVGNDGANDVASTTGFPLQSGQSAVVTVPNLNTVYFDVTANGDKVAWLRIDQASN
jgi:hypothetical protein